MFTGIIEAKGEISSLEQAGGDLRAVISSETLDFSDIKPGDSICVSGVCLTATEINDNSFSVDISNETIALTSFTGLQAGDRVNLEKAMQPASRFGGHIVSGHVDGLVELLSREDDGRSERLVFLAPETLRKYIAAKGSVCLEGISLTVNEVKGGEFGVNIIPHTAQETTLGTLEPGSKVNLEVDIISRYLESLILGREIKGDSEAITFEKLVQFGFAEKTEYSKQGRDKP
ncbi:MAG: riboflavin synthase [Gammaproteobacteria bacterium]|nr:riboflavin synthase [Gammaproteobacteria bacterium]